MKFKLVSIWLLLFIISIVCSLAAVPSIQRNAFTTNASLPLASFAGPLVTTNGDGRVSASYNGGGLTNLNAASWAALTAGTNAAVTAATNAVFNATNNATGSGALVRASGAVFDGNGMAWGSATNNGAISSNLWATTLSNFKRRPAQPMVGYILPYDTLTHETNMTYAVNFFGDPTNAMYRFVKAGQFYLHLDVGWAATARDSNGRLCWNSNRFPNGLIVDITAAHAKGIKVGLYGQTEALQNDGSIGQLGHYEDDAITLASWGIDSFKLDGNNISTQPTEHEQGLLRMASILKTNERPIYLSTSFSNFPPDVHFVIDSWRANGRFGDFTDFSKMNQGIDFYLANWFQQGPNHVMDFGGVYSSTALGSESFAYRSLTAAATAMWHGFALSVNIISDTAFSTVFTNEVWWEIFSDPLVSAPRLLSSNKLALCFWEPLSDGSYAVMLQNRNTYATNMTLNFADIGCSRFATVRDAATQVYSSAVGGYGATVLATNFAMFVVTPQPDSIGISAALSAVPTVSPAVTVTAIGAPTSFTGKLGFNFAPSNNIMVTTVKRWVMAGDNGLHTIGIYDSNGIAIRTVTLNLTNATTNTFAVTNFAAPVLCLAGVNYECWSVEDSSYDRYNTLTTTYNSMLTNTAKSFTTTTAPTVQTGGASYSTDLDWYVPRTTILDNLTLAGTVSGNGGGLTNLQSMNIIGSVKNASAAAAGYVGEVVSASLSSGSHVSLSSSATTVNIVSISLTAGDWDVCGNVTFEGTFANAIGQGGISATSATMPANEITSFTPLPTSMNNATASPVRTVINVSSTTTVYLVAKPTFASGTYFGYGSINARRIR